MNEWINQIKWNKNWINEWNEWLNKWINKWINELDTYMNGLINE